MPRTPVPPRLPMNRFAYGVLKVSSWLLLHLAFGFRVSGREHEPRSGPCIIIANHASVVDTLAVGVALRRRTYFMGKQELFTQPVLWWLLPTVGTFPVRRGEADRFAMRRSLEVLRRGEPLCIFIEGTRSLDGTLGPAEPGAAIFALRTGVPILPVAVIGGHRIMPKGARLPRLRPLRVRMGPVFRLDASGNGRSRRDAVEHGRQVMMKTLADLMGEQAVGPSG